MLIKTLIFVATFGYVSANESWSKSSSFVLPPCKIGTNDFYYDAQSASSEKKKNASALKMGLFEDFFKGAFANDEGLSSDKSTGQLEYDDNDDSESNFFGSARRAANPVQQTDVQKRWLAAQQKEKDRKNVQFNGGGAIRGIKGAPVSQDVLIGTTWVLDLYLSGVPKRDPSNDLYGSRVNISNRDRSVSLGVAVPEKPTVSLKVVFEKDDVCRAESTAFTTGALGEYKLSSDNKFIRFSIDTLGFQRVVKTTGSITKVFWSEEEDAITKTSSTYSIPEGNIFADTSIGYGKPGELVMGDTQTVNGVLRIEQRMGVLGAASRMVVCGKFSAKMVME